MNLINTKPKESERMFELVSKYKPTGDQPQAIDYLVKGINEGKKFQTLLGVTRFSVKLLQWQI